MFLSDSAQIIVDVEVCAERAPELACVLRAWLVDEGIIEQESTDSVLSDAGGHRPGRNYRIAVKTDDDAFLRLATNGVEIVVGRRVAFDTGVNGTELRCHACGNAFEPDRSWSDAVGAWFEGDNEASFPCSSCGHRAPLTEWRGRLPWGFGNLGLQFWNWPPLSEPFIHAISRKLEHRTVTVWRRI
jgi:hypothetical protein